MIAKLFNWLSGAWHVWRMNSDNMAWNIFLALIPLALSFWLFRRYTPKLIWRGSWSEKLPSIIWGLGCLVFLAFLPNAPYVLSDIRDMIRDIRSVNSEWVVSLILLPQYLLYMIIGFVAYVLSLMNVGHYLRKQELKRWILPTELTLHLLCAIGIYIGRFQRFNSWDIVSQPYAVGYTVLDDLIAKRPIVVMILTFLLISGLYWLFREVFVAIRIYIAFRWRAKRQKNGDLLNGS